ncbi:MAG: glycosyltransferase family 1 protein [Candidatus Saccharibacteria bacterium]
MKHIVIDARIINSSTGTYVERLLHYLQEIDQTNKYTVLVPKKDLDFWKPTAKNFTVAAADFPNYSLGEQIGFKKLLDGLSADLVHFCMPQQPIWYRGAHVTTIHDLTLLRVYNSDKNWLTYHIKQFVGRFVFKHVARSSQQIIVPTQFTKNDLLSFVNITPKKITVTYESADISIDKLEAYKHPFKRFILYVGQQGDYKNIKRLGDAHQQLLSKHPDLGLILVGRMNDRTQANKDYFDNKHYKNIHFTGFLPDTQRDWLYKNAAAYIFPSLSEGFGLPGLEAMGYGAPVVSSNATCLPEVYGDAAIYFDPNSTDDMADAIRKILNNDKLRDEQIKKGYQQLNKYSWRKMATETHDVYLKALK